MPHINPSRPKYDPENDLTEDGQFLAECVDVRYGLANRRFPNGKPNMAIEFAVDDPERPDLAGKTVAIICTESVFKDKKTGQESNLVTHARLMGVKDPESGFNPDTFIGKHYRIQVEEHEGRMYVRAAMSVTARKPGTNGKPAASTPAPPPLGDPDAIPF